MSKPQIVGALKMEKYLFFLGFKKTRQKGSHRFYRHLDGRTTTLPHHKGRDLAPPLIREILREIEISIDDFNEYLKKI